MRFNMEKIYTVISVEGVNVADIEKDLKINTGIDTIPDRPCKSGNKMSPNTRMSKWWLTKEEAHLLYNDPRVMTVQDDEVLEKDEAIDSKGVFNHPHYNVFQGEEMLFYTTHNQVRDSYNGLSWKYLKMALKDAHLPTDDEIESVELRDTPYTYNNKPVKREVVKLRPYTYDADGEGVDLVVFDQEFGALYNPEFEAKGGKGYRLHNPNWLLLSGDPDNLANDPEFLERCVPDDCDPLDPDFYYGNKNDWLDIASHGSGIAAQAAGRTAGAAKGAHIYSLRSGNGIGTDELLQMVLNWHNKKMSSNGNKRPTVMLNCSPSKGFTRNMPTHGVYRGVPWTRDGRTSIQLKSAYGVPCNAVLEGTNPDGATYGRADMVGKGSETWSRDIIMGQMIDAGIHIVRSGGNDYIYGDLPPNTQSPMKDYNPHTGTDWDNWAYFPDQHMETEWDGSLAGTDRAENLNKVYYHRGGRSPWADGVINVGELSPAGGSNFQNVLDTSGDFYIRKPTATSYTEEVVRDCGHGAHIIMNAPTYDAYPRWHYDFSTALNTETFSGVEITGWVEKNRDLYNNPIPQDVLDNASFYYRSSDNKNIRGVFKTINSSTAQVPYMNEGYKTNDLFYEQNYGASSPNGLTRLPYARNPSDPNFNMSSTGAGTSYAAPKVAGVVCCILEKEPNLTPFEVHGRLLESMKKLASDRSAGSDIQNWQGKPEYLPVLGNPHAHIRYLDVKGKLTFNSGNLHTNSELSIPNADATKLSGTSDTITFSVKDEDGNLYVDADLSVDVRCTFGSLGSITDNGDGTYSVVYTVADAITGVETITAYIYGKQIQDTLIFNFADTDVPAITSGHTVYLDEGTGANQQVYTAISNKPDATFSLDAGSDAELSIDSNTGVVTLSDNPTFATKSQYSFGIIADRAFSVPSAVHNVVLYVYDKIAPSITVVKEDADTLIYNGSAHVAFVTENTGANQKLLSLSVSDASPYTITKDSSSVDAEIVIASNGDISLTVDPDYETQTTYNAVARIADFAGNSTLVNIEVGVTNVDDAAPVFVDVNDNPITSYPTLPAIDEHTMQGQVIHTFRAIDDGDGTDGNITYSLPTGGSFSENGNNYNASLDSSTGALTLDADIEYDSYGTNSGSSYTMFYTVDATDAAGNTTRTGIYIPINEVLLDPVIVRADLVTNNFHDVDDTYNLPENVQSNGIARYVCTNAAEEGYDQQVSWYYSGNYAGIQKATNQYANFVTLYNMSPFDYESLSESAKQKNIVLKAVFPDGRETSVNVTINITDVDEVGPTVTSSVAPAFNTMKSAGATTGYTVTATDDNLPVTYSIVAGNYTIDANTGELFTSIDVNHGDVYGNLTVGLTDSLGNTSQVAIQPTSVDPTNLVITSSSQGNQLRAVFGVPPDEHNILYQATANEPVTWSFAGGITSFFLDGNLFEINPTTGQVYIEDIILNDYAKVYTVVATHADGTTASIQVTNQVTPTFSSDVITIEDDLPDMVFTTPNVSLAENVPIGTTVGTYTAKKQDNSVAPVYWTLENNQSGDPFVIDPDTGVVTTNTTFDYETLTSYSYTVQAWYRYDEKPIKAGSVTITDVDEDKPVWVGSTNVIEVPAGSSNTAILDATADWSDASSMTFAMTSGGYSWTGPHYTFNGSNNHVYLNGTFNSVGPNKSFGIIATDANGNSELKTYHVNVVSSTLEMIDVSVGSGNFYGNIYYGFSQGSYAGYGSFVDVSSGNSYNKYPTFPLYTLMNNVYAPYLKDINYDVSQAKVKFAINHSSSGTPNILWNTMDIDGNVFQRSQMSLISYSTYKRWERGSSNPFGSTTGAVKRVTWS